MLASFFDFAALHDDDLVCIPHCGQTVRHDDNRLLASSDQLIECLLDLELRFSVQGRRRLVKKQDFGLTDQSSSDGDPLLLTPG